MSQEKPANKFKYDLLRYLEIQWFQNEADKLAGHLKYKVLKGPHMGGSIVDYKPEIEFMKRMNKKYIEDVENRGDKPKLQGMLVSAINLYLGLYMRVDGLAEAHNKENDVHTPACDFSTHIITSLLQLIHGFERIEARDAWGTIPDKPVELLRHFNYVAEDDEIRTEGDEDNFKMPVLHEQTPEFIHDALKSVYALTVAINRLKDLYPQLDPEIKSLRIKCVDRDDTINILGVLKHVFEAAVFFALHLHREYGLALNNYDGWEHEVDDNTKKMLYSVTRLNKLLGMKCLDHDHDDFMKSLASFAQTLGEDVTLEDKDRFMALIRNTFSPDATKKDDTKKTTYADIAKHFENASISEDDE